MASPHALVFPYPAQSHIISLLELSYCLIDHGFKITFLNTEFNHQRLLAALPKETCSPGDIIMTGGIHFVAIPDGLGPEEDRNDLGKLSEGILAVMPGCLEELIATRNAGADKFTCVVADQSMAWALDVAKKTGLRSSAFFPAAAAVFAVNLNIPKLIKDGIIDQQGAPKRLGMFRLGPGMIPMDPAQLFWNCFEDPKTRRIMFQYVVNNNKSVANAELIICNSFDELENPVFAHTRPALLPVGPMLSGSRLNRPVGNLWPQDASYMDWLDEQPAGSVIYVAFGSFTILNPVQLEELAAGLELSCRPFLWATRPDLFNGTYISPRGRMVGWCPQQKVVSHRAVGCFVSHCGWNSTLEGVRNGLPFICWPYFCDQFLNESYICDVWRVGKRMVADENGVYTREEIASKVEEVVGDVGIRERCSALKKKALGTLERGGISFENLRTFADAMRAV